MGKKTLVIAVNILLSLLGIFVALLITEVILRLTHNRYNGLGAALEIQYFRQGNENIQNTFTVDPDFGFRPILGNRLYNEQGTLKNEYSLEKSGDRTRVLFLGDSVTARGKIIKALRAAYGEERFEYWNAGVESFNTIQEVNFYKKYNSSIDADHVILTLHNNDFQTTPVAFRNEENQIMLYNPRVPRRKLNGWLFQHSLLYRLCLGKIAELNYERLRGEINREVHRSIEELADILKAEGIKFTILIHPILKPYDRWRDYEKEQHNNALRIMQELNIRYFDLREPLQQAIEDGVTLRGTSRWHPGTQISRYFARYLYDHKLLTGLSSPPVETI